MTIPAQGSNARKSSSAYAPKFKNPVPLPPIDDFRLSNILAKSLADHSEAVAQSLLNVTTKFQTDLRTEIRRALTIEQKIQYKNIQVAKLAHSIQKELELRSKRFDRVSRTSDDKNRRISSSSGLSSDVDRVLELSLKVSASMQSLGVRLARIDRGNGGSGFPNPHKYPKLAKLLEKLDPESVVESHMDDCDVYSASLEEPLIIEDYVNGSDYNNGLEDASTPGYVEIREIEHVNGGVQMNISRPLEEEASLSQNGLVPSKILGSGSPRSESLNTKASDSKTSNSNSASKSLTYKSKKSNSSRSKSPKSSSSRSKSPLAESSKSDVDPVDTTQIGIVHAKGISAPDLPLQPEEETEELDAEAFELLIDTNVEKYRQLRDKQYENLDIFGSLSTKYRSPANPLRLLFSSTILENSDMLLTLANDAEGLHSPFAPAKAIPTVSETPLMSLHKKLRINALPMKYSSLVLSKQCECASSDSPARKALEATLLKQRQRELNDDDELWSSSGLHTETEENETDQLLWSNSSDPDSSSDSEDDATSNTNQYYLSLKKDLRSKQRRRAKKRANVGFRNENSPTPKHQPSHRTLRPKQSILKMKSAVKTTGKIGKKLTLTPSPSIDQLSQFKMDTPYRSSPRGSFVNDYLAVGFIVRSREPEEDTNSDDGDLEDNDNGESVDDGNKLKTKSTGDESNTVSKLRKLLI
ncbi:CIC11C00000005056 [Sungouiella intermedia]|uniref:CIC11C00000005056 n=1 Tax=Sungouiella intermedia TaxID=45354 RepID=A0A1L0C469_9ASCO|nr:CIC11C00000005056 [[Candida] intermedia]